MAETPQNPTPETGTPRKKGIGFGLFLMLIGIIMLAQQAGWLPVRLDWLFPAILIAWGASEIFQRLK